MLLDQQSAATGGSIWGYSGRDDVLVAGLGDKFMNGEGGNDTYVYSSSGGNDIIADQGNFLSTLQFTDINSTDVTLLRLNNGADLLIAINTTGKVVTVRREWANGGPLRAITFADGVSWDRSQIETILGSNAAGGAGQSYTFHRGGGQVTLDTSVNTVKMDSTITPDDVILQANGSDLVVRLRDSTDVFTVSGDLTHSGWGTSSTLHRLTFANGATIDIGQPSAGQGTPIIFTWLGNTTNFDVTGTTFGTNVYEAEVGGRFTFADSSAAGGTTLSSSTKARKISLSGLNGISGSIELGAQVAAQDGDWQANQYGDLILRLRGDSADSINVGSDLQLANSVVTSAIKTIKFSDGTVLDMSHGPSNFTWLGNTANFTINGTTFGTNVYEVTVGGRVNFADASAVGARTS